MTPPPIVTSLQAVGVPLRCIQYLLAVTGGPHGRQQAFALHPPDEYPHVRNLRAEQEAARQMGELFGQPQEDLRCPYGCRSTDECDDRCQR